VKPKGEPELLIGLGKPKGGGVEGSSDEEASESPDEEMSEKDEHLSDAFDALKSGDREGFIDSMKKCILLADEGGYTGPEGEGEG